jgi:DNA-binding NarL/FixJ family response regulator
MISIEQQIAIVRKIAEGMRTKEIAELMGNSPKTIEKHIELMKVEHAAKTLPHLVHIFHLKKMIR